METQKNPKKSWSLRRGGWGIHTDACWTRMMGRYIFLIFKLIFSESSQFLYSKIFVKVSTAFRQRNPLQARFCVHFSRCVLSSEGRGGSNRWFFSSEATHMPFHPSYVKRFVFGSQPYISSHQFCNLGSACLPDHRISQQSAGLG